MDVMVKELTFLQEKHELSFVELNLDYNEQSLIDTLTLKPNVVDRKVSWGEFLATPVQTRNVTIDGVSGVGKTSIGRRITYPFEKINKYIQSIAMNNSPSPAMGFFCSGVELMYEKQGCVWDRDPFNNLLWHNIWLSFAQAIRTDTVSLKSCKKYEYIIPKTLIELLYVSKTIIIIDTNEEAASKRLESRALGSDKFRSTWPFYIKFRNYFYTSLCNQYPEHFYLIDLNKDFYRDQTTMQDWIIARIPEMMQCMVVESKFKFVCVPVSFPSLDKENERCRTIQIPLLTEQPKVTVNKLTSL